MNWLLIGAVLVLLFVIFKSKEIRHKFSSIFIIVIVLFLIFSFSQVVSKPGVNFSSVAGMLNACKIYFLWLKTVVGNLGQITGNAVKLDWSANLTNFSR
jgi:ABC-type polysaccharide/polyol phosphate export permease